MTLLTVDRLSHSFAAPQGRHQVFSDLNLELESGEFLCIIGPSGCGKTTLLRMIGGFIRPESGHILINGEEIGAPGRHCATVFQTFDQLFPWRTALGNVAWPMLMQHKTDNRREAEAAAREYLSRVGLKDCENYYPHQLSGGMKQRVAIARALALRPSLILMDEPFASLDADSRTMLQRELKQLWNESGLTVIFVTHSIIEAISLSTRILALGRDNSGIRLYEPNPVGGDPRSIRNPASPGYSEYWDKLNHILRG